MLLSESSPATWAGGNGLECGARYEQSAAGADLAGLDQPMGVGATGSEVDCR